MTEIDAAYKETGAQQKSGGVTTGGLTDNKEDAAADAIRKVVLLAGFTTSYASEKNDHDLFEQMDMSFSLLDKLPDEALAPRLTKMVDTMRTIGDPLVEFGVTEEKLQAAEKAIGHFSDLSPSPRVAISGRKTSNDNIPGLLKQMRKAFDSLDKLIKGFTDENPDFVKTYFNARIIVDLGVRHDKDDDKK